jgi:acyl-CoA synthetase (AMP-forming)/AMP-acid ligase II
MNNIGEMFHQRAVVSPALEAYVEPSTNVRVDYSQMNALINRAAHVIESLGIAKGERIALLMPNSLEFCCLFYAAAKLGVVVVPLNTRLTAPELEFLLSDSGAKALFYGEEFAGVVASLKTGTAHPLAVNDWVPATSSAGSLAKLLSAAVSALVPALGSAGSLAERLGAAASDEPACTSGGQDNLFIMYTSGTTGLPKGVVHTHDSVHCAVMSWANTIDIRYKDRILLPLPMFHVAALTTVIVCAARGITLVSMPNFDPMKVWSLIIEERVTVAGGVPAILNFMRQVPQFAELQASPVRYFITGGAPLPKALIEIYAAKHMEVVQGYALTESCGGGSLLLNDDALRKIGSAGRAAMFIDIRLRHADGSLHEKGSGEVVMKSDFLLKEYWNRPDATRDAFDNGWFRTGDIADIDDEGFIYIKDRIKDMIISGGENIYPAEIENVILGHSSVKEVAVIGLPDEKWGEIACAIIVGDQAQGGAEQILAHCESRLARYKLPKKFIFVEAIPRNPAGKVLKRVLRDQYAA